MNAKQRRVARQRADFTAEVSATATAFLAAIEAAVMPAAEAIVASGIGDQLEALTRAAMDAPLTAPDPAAH